MKGNKFFIGVLIVSMMLMGAGYAAWTQNLTVTQTVEAGQLDFTIEVSDVNETEGSATANYSDFTVDTATDGVIAVSTVDMYPGVSNTYTITATNASTMKTELDVDFTSTTGTEAKDIALESAVEYAITFKIGDAPAVPVTSFEALATALNGLQVEEDENVEILVVETLPIEAENVVENGSIGYELEFTFKQFNDTLDY